ncbi:hypothetical protein HXX76_007287 [Chlamydomonas incerta]|uniref:Uncharacterized protein n=1 Tax=Chlamydomonas incerta TaxID=51695 RepID=A0A835SXX7_CHLIN|nr:hypothetical protein HXX76_007287 [Chlamydomonas incerta]|eukprot:KAG2435204.1 hypothetical protein HXX76_007287 [Chlamydomonas incerta]
MQDTQARHPFLDLAGYGGGEVMKLICSSVGHGFLSRLRLVARPLLLATDAHLLSDEHRIQLPTAARAVSAEHTSTNVLQSFLRMLARGYRPRVVRFNFIGDPEDSDFSASVSDKIAEAITWLTRRARQRCQPSAGSSRPGGGNAAALLLRLFQRVDVNAAGGLGAGAAEPAPAGSSGGGSSSSSCPHRLASLRLKHLLGPLSPGMRQAVMQLQPAALMLSYEDLDRAGRAADAWFANTALTWLRELRLDSCYPMIKQPEQQGGDGGGGGGGIGVADGGGVAVLPALTNLTHLVLNNRCGDGLRSTLLPIYSLAAFTHLSHLRELRLYPACLVAGQELTALTALTRLKVATLLPPPPPPPPAAAAAAAGPAAAMVPAAAVPTTTRLPLPPPQPSTSTAVPVPAAAAAVEAAPVGARAQAQPQQPQGAGAPVPRRRIAPVRRAEEPERLPDIVLPLKLTVRTLRAALLPRLRPPQPQQPPILVSAVDSSTPVCIALSEVNRTRFQDLGGGPVSDEIVVTEQRLSGAVPMTLAVGGTAALLAAFRSLHGPSRRLQLDVAELEVRGRPHELQPAVAPDQPGVAPDQPGGHRWLSALAPLALRSLILTYWLLGAEDLQTIGERLQSLQRLVLNHGDYPLPAMRSLALLPQLRQLDLHGREPIYMDRVLADNHGQSYLQTGLNEDTDPATAFVDLCRAIAQTRRSAAGGHAAAAPAGAAATAGPADAAVAVAPEVSFAVRLFCNALGGDTEPPEAVTAALVKQINTQLQVDGVGPREACAQLAPFVDMRPPGVDDRRLVDGGGEADSEDGYSTAGDGD